MYLEDWFFIDVIVPVLFQLSQKIVHIIFVGNVTDGYLWNLVFFQPDQIHFDFIGLDFALLRTFSSQDSNFEKHLSI